MYARHIRVAMAARSFERLTFPAIDHEALRRHQRPVVVLAGTPAPPEQALRDKLAGELRRRGWNLPGPLPTEEQHGFVCSSDKAGWILSLSRGSVPKEQMAAWPPPARPGRAMAGTCNGFARPRS